MEFLMTLVSSIIIVLAAQAAAAQAPASPGTEAGGTVAAAAETKVEAAKEADPVVCERVGEVGSLIRAKKVCMRKSQWEEQRRSDRSLVERTQIQRGMTGN